MHQETIDQAQEVIKRGEKINVLLEYLLSELGLLLEDKPLPQDIWRRLKECQDEYDQACKTLSTIIHEHGLLQYKIGQPEEGVSVSNY